MPIDKSIEYKFNIIKELGEGGNANVYLVRPKDADAEEEFALKELYNKTREKKCRFIEEIKIIEKNFKIIDGIMPIIESSTDKFWYTMPVAVSIIEHIEKSRETIVDIIRGIIQLAQTLSELHAKQVSHRDIKPDNIYFYNGRYCLGDFGLVDHPDNPHEFTRSDRGLGAIFTIAPEMKRDPRNADGTKADVFSLAKTTWMLLAGDGKGFDGVYNFLDKTHALRFMKRFSGVHIAELEDLLAKSTDNSPTLRPNIDSFKQQLETWLDVYSDFNKSQESDWQFLNRYLFGDHPQESAVWSDKDTIIDILNNVGTLPAYNHMFFSTGGGLDFKCAEPANEDGCIYIYETGECCFLLKPKRLCFEAIGENYTWNYFCLELDKLSPVLVDSSRSDEFLVEDTPAHYVSAEYVQYGVYDYDSGEPLPDGYKTVRRFLSGKMLIVLKSGPYNCINATYDGRHGLCTNMEFREYIEGLAEKYDRLISKGYSEYTILNSREFSQNPFDKTENNVMDEIGNLSSEYRNSICSKKDCYLNWCFKDVFVEHSAAKNIAFYFQLQENGRSSFLFDPDKRLYLCTDGRIKKLGDSNLEEIYYVYNRMDARLFNNVCSDYIAQKCIEIGCPASNIIRYYFSIRFRRLGKPTYLFSKSDIEELMRNADDRETNILVVDENGHAKIIQDIGDRFLYPVRNEAWQAGNNYVGKYSRLSTLDDVYTSCLEGWLLYLGTGQEQYIDIYAEAREEELIKAIEAYY